MPDRPGPGDVARRLATRVRRRGPAEVLGLAAQRLREGIHSDAELTVLVRALTPALRAPRIEGLELREAGASDAWAVSRDIGSESPATFRRRLSERTSCWIVTEVENVLHSSWTTSFAAWTRETRSFFRPPGADAYLHESYTIPAARGRGIYRFALDGIAATLGSRGIPRLWIAVESDNTPSLRAVSKAGFEEAGRMQLSRRWGLLRVEGDTEVLSGGSRESTP